GILLIVDEVQTGLGRTGHMFACESAGIDPDVMVLSKAIGGGLPLAAIVYRQSIDLWKPGAHAGTFRGNQLGFAAGAAAIRHIRAGKLHLHARAMGSRLMEALENIAARTPIIGNIRGRGLMAGAEIVEPDGERQGSQPPPPSPALARQIQLSCLRRGLMVELGGRGGSVVRFLPPLIVTADEIDQIAARFGAAIEAVESEKDASL
ncbi:MAG TPA: aminotransferase class III-fold pyridoxal phosphate-dependent enzyme, partial [Methylocella sp.]|nr:aminotransferase class III-fold pyridoxal phosphate-dependent enzyme [Methylocella sp.]